MHSKAIRLVTVIALLCISAVSVWLSARGFATQVPDDALKPDAAVHDFGAVGQNEKRQHVFSLHNSGDEPIHIISVQTSCGCTVAEYKESDLQPGEKLALQLTFETGRSRGRVHTRCDVFYLSGASAAIQSVDLTLVATVQPDLEIAPSSISFLHVDETTPSRVQDVVISAGRVEHFRIVGVECTHPAFSAKVLEPSEAGQVTVQITFAPEKWLGFSKLSELRITTNAPHEQVLYVPLKGPAVDTRKVNSLVPSIKP